jgi:hypothetical protein
MTSCSAINYLKSNSFEPHQHGNYGLYGLNLLGCDSTIKFENDIWHFLYFKENIAVYTNVHGQHLLLDTIKPTDNITRMQVKN